MAWIAEIDEREAEGSLKDQYSKLKEPWGGIDNILKIHSLNPESLAAHVQLYKTVMFGKSPIPKDSPGNDCSCGLIDKSMPLLNNPSWRRSSQTQDR